MYQDSANQGICRGFCNLHAMHRSSQLNAEWLKSSSKSSTKIFLQSSFVCAESLFERQTIRFLRFGWFGRSMLLLRWRTRRYEANTRSALFLLPSLDGRSVRRSDVYKLQCTVSCCTASAPLPLSLFTPWLFPYCGYTTR
jgi:hypothetical protein